MCGTCGCGSEEGGVRILAPFTGQDREILAHHHHDHHHHGHTHEHGHPHTHGHGHHHHGEGSITMAPNKKVIEVEQDVLHQNQVMAARNRGYFEALNIFTLNLVSSPGSGKTALLERTLKDLKDSLNFYVIEGE